MPGLLAPGDLHPDEPSTIRPAIPSTVREGEGKIRMVGILRYFSNSMAMPLSRVLTVTARGPGACWNAAIGPRYGGQEKRAQYENRRIDTFMTSPSAAMTVKTLEPP